MKSKDQKERPPFVCICGRINKDQNPYTQDCLSCDKQRAFGVCIDEYIARVKVEIAQDKKSFYLNELEKLNEIITQNQKEDL